MKIFILMSLFSTPVWAAPIQLSLSPSDRIELLGIDSNRNGVRDDVDFYITEKTKGYESKNSKQTQALLQLAADYQNAIGVISNEKKAIVAAKKIILSQYCLKSIMGLDAGYAEAIRLKGKVLNTIARSRVGIRLNTYEAKAGLNNMKESDWKKGCRFK